MRSSNEEEGRNFHLRMIVQMIPAAPMDAPMATRMMIVFFAMEVGAFVFVLLLFSADVPLVASGSSAGWVTVTKVTSEPEVEALTETELDVEVEEREGVDVGVVEVLWVEDAVVLEDCEALVELLASPVGLAPTMGRPSVMPPKIPETIPPPCVGEA